MSYVYVLRTGLTANDGTPVSKIGFTTRDPMKRLRELQTGSATQLTLAGYIASPRAKQLERRAHERFRPSKLELGGTEFFSVDTETVLNWLRAEEPKFASKQNHIEAWERYQQLAPIRLKNFLGMAGVAIIPLGLFFIGLSMSSEAVQLPFPNSLIFLFAIVFMYPAVFAYTASVDWVVIKLYGAQIDDEKRAISERYHIPIECVDQAPK
jgi:hypothetical protein